MCDSEKGKNARSPAVSVIITAYNAARSIRKCVESIMAQTFRDFECVVVDDGSADSTAEIVGALAEADARVRLVKRENGGQSAALNTGLAGTGGKYVYMMDSDDEASPCLLEAAVGALEADPGADFATFDFARLSNPAQKPVARADAVPAPVKVPSALDFWLSTGRDHNIWMSVYRRAAIDGIRFPEGYIHQDFFFNYMFFKGGRRGVYLPCALYAYDDCTPGSITNSPMSKRKVNAMFDLCRMLYEAYASAPAGEREKLRRRALQPRIKDRLKNVYRSGDADLVELAGERAREAFRLGILRFSGFTLRWKFRLLRILLSRKRSKEG